MRSAGGPAAACARDIIPDGYNASGTTGAGYYRVAAVAARRQRRVVLRSRTPRMPPNRRNRVRETARVGRVCHVRVAGHVRYRTADTVCLPRFERNYEKSKSNRDTGV